MGRRDWCEDVVNDMVRTNLQWDINYRVPVEMVVVENMSSIDAVAQIHVMRGNKDVVVNDLRNDFSFVPAYLPRFIRVKEKDYFEYIDDIEQILLHELNHWYTYVYKGMKIQSHGKEFKKFGRKNGLTDRFNRAKIGLADDEVMYHYIKCSKCGEDLRLKARTRDYAEHHCEFGVTECCGAKKVYGGKMIYKKTKSWE